MSLKGKVIVVVGASGLIGREIVSSLVACEAKIVATDISISNEIKEKYCGNDSVRLVNIDITDSSSIDQVLSDAAKEFGRVEGAVNTAYPRNKNYGNKYLDVTYDDFCENLSLHLGGYFLFTQRCLQYSLNNDQEFSLVNMSSIYGVISPRFEVYEGTEMTMPVEYAAIKAALIHLDKYVSKFSKGAHFRVNDVSPGGVFDGQAGSFLRKYSEHCRTQGMVSSNDVVNAIKFLLSNESAMICGQNIIVDDGFTN